MLPIAAPDVCLACLDGVHALTAAARHANLSAYYSGRISVSKELVAVLTRAAESGERLANAATTFILEEGTVRVAEAAGAGSSAAVATAPAPAGWGTYRLRLKSATGIEIWVRGGPPCGTCAVLATITSIAQADGALLVTLHPLPRRRPGTWWRTMSSSAPPGWWTACWTCRLVRSRSTCSSGGPGWASSRGSRA